MARLEHLIGIADALRTTYPFSHQMRQIWLRQPHRRFEQQSPLAVIQAQGIEGMLKFGRILIAVMALVALGKPRYNRRKERGLFGVKALPRWRRWAEGERFSKKLRIISCTLTKSLLANK